MKDKIRIVQRDILQLKVDAIICQANQELEIEDPDVKRLFNAGGDEVYSDCDNLYNLDLGSAVVTSAGALPAQYIIHAVMNENGKLAEEEIAMLAIASALQKARELQLQSVSMLLIGQSVGIPMKRSAELIFSEIKKHCDDATSLTKIYLVATSDYEEESLEDALKQM
ncbi:MAG: macro domain-containing protein [Planctomycetes bacterium]|jgi:O-acetyl-ADP-ribose deacetylase (regulator of RNase III)|nr:macro domain-containing protein [Planctomycetota bacterium]HNZ66895.1 macro domain-containing protein [Planctomycetota bacterium]HPY75250.1 macro domain-containing protein [Planctomycetota bacterium]HQB00798.1 macro domain-containing protein [Planctomycetota bacterium]HRU51996.1 macro domain-containing protein [Planctomycetota bacterium]